jgi:hypothetical protein
MILINFFIRRKPPQVRCAAVPNSDDADVDADAGACAGANASVGVVFAGALVA